jgi:SAM-dependent methyltransferase
MALIQEEARVPPDDRWLFLQTALTGPARREWVAHWPVGPLGAWVDWGAAYGALSVEVAQRRGGAVYAVDWSRARLEAAARCAERVAHRGIVLWTAADVMTYRPPEPVVGMSARFLLQHLPDPAGALAHWASLLDEGGWLMVEDVDDGWTVEHPEPPARWNTVVMALQQLQKSRGGDRQIGRRLPQLLTEAGFVLAETDVALQGAWVSPEAFALSRQLERLRLDGEREALLAGGHLTAAEWEAGVAARAAATGPVFMTAGTIRVRARKRAPTGAPRADLERLLT